MALVLKEVPIQFLPVGVDRLQVTVSLPVQTEIFALLQDARLGPRVLTRQDPARPLEARTFVALQVGPLLVETDRQALYVGSFEGYYRTISQDPPAEGEPPPPSEIKKEVYHLFEISGPLKPETLPAELPEVEPLPFMVNKD